MASIAARFLQTGNLKQEEKKLIEFIKPVDETIKEKLHGMANNGFGATKPCLITIELIREIYRIRTCNRILPKDIGKDRPCLNYHIGHCSAPCQGNISSE